MNKDDILTNVQYYEKYHNKPIDQTRMKKIIGDWQTVLPDMAPIYGPIPGVAGLHKRLGPLLISLFFIKESGRYEYNLIFCVHNLMVNNENYILGALSSLIYQWDRYDSHAEQLKPIIHQSFKDTEYEQLLLSRGIGNGLHRLLYPAVAELLTKETYSLLTPQPVSLVEMQNIFLSKINSATSKIGMEFPFLLMICLWSKDFNSYNKFLNWSNLNPKVISDTNFSLLNNKSDGLKYIDYLAKNTNNIKKIVEEQVIKHKLGQISYKDFINTT